MGIKQLVLTIFYEEEAFTENGEPYIQTRSIEVDLVNDKIQDFLNAIPETISEDTSMVWVAIRRKDDSTIAFVDGVIRQSGGNHNETVRKSSCDNEYAQKLRHNARIFAERRWKGMSS